MNTKEPQKETRKETSLVQKVAKVLLKIVLFLFLLVVVLFLLIFTPPVQRFATTKVENFLQKKLGTEVEIGSISFSLTGRINLENIYFEDQKKDTLLSGGQIKANVTLSKLFNNEVEVKDLVLRDITAKIKRVLPDTTFNFQYIVDAFVTQQTAQPDTAQTAPLKMALDKLTLANVAFTLNDMITGNDMFVKIGDLAARFDTIDPFSFHFDVPSLQVRDMVARIKQYKPLVEPEPISKDLAEASAPTPMNLNFGTIDLRRIDLNYANDISAFYTLLNIGQLKVDGKKIDLANNAIHLDEIVLNDSKSVIRLGKAPAAKVVKKEVKQEVAVQQQMGWKFLVDKINIDHNTFQFDDDNSPRLSSGMDYAHMHAEDLTLRAENFIMVPDSTGARITEGHMKEKSGLQLEALKGDLLYAYNQSYLKNFYIKTPGTELKRGIVLEYASYDALMKQLSQTVMDVNIDHSYVQVKDILLFAPQLRSNPAFKNPNDVWRLNMQASGTMNRLYVEALQFDGFQNTKIDASGTLASLTDPNQAGGTFTIRKLHTTRNDIATIAGPSLPKDQINLPETIDASGTLSGNASNLLTNLRINTSSGSATINGHFSNLTNPTSATYNAQVRTSGLQLGKILRNPQMGSLTGTFTANGKGFTPDAMRTDFRGVINSLGFNNYQYHNISLKGNLNGSNYKVTTEANDPNADFSLTATGSYAAKSSLKLDGFVDSIKTLPLNFTTQPLIFRGKITGDIPSLDPNNLEADVFITNALFVSDTSRLPLDTLHLVANKTDTGQYINLTSDIINAQLSGQYQLTELGTILQDNIQPYFSVAPYRKTAVKPYNIFFTADVIYDPILSVFVPGLTNMENIHATGSLSSGQGLQANISAPYILYSSNEINHALLNVATSDSGLMVTSTVDRLKSGSIHIYKVQLNAKALNNIIDFALGIDDKNGKDIYNLSGNISQPKTGDFIISLKPENLMLHYEPWTIAPNNSIALINNQIIANNFVMQKGDQQLSLQSASQTGAPPLDVRFTNFRISTITGFIQPDTLLANGIINGSITLRNLMQQPVFTSDLNISDLSFKQDTIGNIALKVNSEGNRYQTNATITGKGNDVSLTGYFEPQGSNDIALDLDLAIRRIELAALQGISGGFIKSASGSINGDVSINGTTSKPLVQGKINFDSSKISTTLLGGPLRINNETVQISEKGIHFDKFTIRDSTNNELTMDGDMLTTNFINYNFDINVRANNFKVINTTKKDNKMFYGDMVITSRMHIGGTEAEPAIDGNVTINDGTDITFVVPQVEPGVADREGVVEFVDLEAPENDSLFRAYDSLNTSAILGFDIAANIEIQKEANFNIVIDAANGDFLNLRGTAQLTAGIDPSGKTTLTGTYEIEEGGYQLTFNFLQRKFNIEKGSKIIWLGEPTNADVDITAVYIANTAPLDLVAGVVPDEQRNYYLQKLPFQLKLKLTGDLMKPQIAFDILLPEDKNYNVSHDVVSTVNTSLTQLRQESSELNKQVLALLLLNRFVGENPFESSGGGFNAESFARQSVSKLLTEQLNQLASGLIEGVDLNFDVASSDDYTTGSRRDRTDLNVGVSKRLMSDRLTVTVGSNFLLEGPQQSNQRSSNIAGNISVNYHLSKDGRYMLRFYRKDEYEGSVDGYIIETGLGFSISVDYNRFRQIFESQKKQAARAAQRQANMQQPKVQ
ncbi:translocation/assembly module TamB domain-containing protein [Chitinophagaceae bacterium LB-8]|uniref:Translocation/assembly module TamB domain-containing protein n=1 Tax=Paraflavisolibacter caeni TaxID=2982496 RepID=A0A9X2XPJ7_9BACT|nr:translocation/assembly module TamB [Paraflavisolibacter caeni]MCU7551069.1 translocation/assembly module TamB domain-containing protein [Paraflavisolibacter caeni]